MGRRALPKIDAQLDLSERLRTLDELPQPWSQDALFGRQAPLEVEVGSGKGLFLANAAAGTPDHNFLGIEVAQKYARFTAARLVQRRVPNAIVVQGDGLRLFREWLPEGSVAAVHVYFPDPWWKARHRKRRVLNEPFLDDAVRVLRVGGRLHFWTDVEEYFETTLELIATRPVLEGPFEPPPREASHDLDFRTHFERRTRLSGLPVFRSEFVKR